MSFKFSEPSNTGVEATEFASSNVVEIKRCGKLSSDRTHNLLCRIHPDLLPHGEGHQNAEEKPKGHSHSAELVIYNLQGAYFRTTFYSQWWHLI